MEKELLQIFKNRLITPIQFYISPNTVFFLFSSQNTQEYVHKLYAVRSPSHMLARLSEFITYFYIYLTSLFIISIHLLNPRNSHLFLPFPYSLLFVLLHSLYYRYN